MFLYLPLRVYTLYLYFFILVLSFLSVLMPTSRQQSHFSNVYSFSGPCGGQILVSVFYFYFCLRSTMPAPYLMVHCGCRHPPSSDFPQWSGIPTTLSLECGVGGVSLPRVSRHTPSSMGPSSTGLWTNACMAANPANAPSGSFHLAFKAANHSINAVRYCFNYCLSTS